MSPESQIIASALSSPQRLGILILLAECPLTTRDITYLIELSQPNTAEHLRKLRRAGLVRREHHGPYVVYELTDARVHRVARSLANLLR